MILKMFGYGLFFEHNSYFLNKWNIFDFFLNILIDFVHLLNLEIEFRIPFLQSIRFFKLLKISPIQIILVKLGSTLWLLAETFTIVLWFIIFYAIWALQLFSGLLLNVCMENISGIQQQIYCGNTDFLCPPGMFCTKALTNPDYGISNYDNLATSAFQVFKIITNDDWTSSMFIIQKTFSKTVWIYYVSLVIFGTFIMMNLILAVLKVKYGQFEEVKSGN